MDMVEKVARAIAAVDHGGGCDLLWESYVPEARAAIEAMMEPTDYMVYRGEGMSDFILDDECFDNSCEGRRKEMRMAYQVMIETALATPAREGDSGV